MWRWYDLYRGRQSRYVWSRNFPLIQRRCIGIPHCIPLYHLSGSHGGRNGCLFFRSKTKKIPECLKDFFKYLHKRIFGCRGLFLSFCPLKNCLCFWGKSAFFNLFRQRRGTWGRSWIFGCYCLSWDLLWCNWIFSLKLKGRKLNLFFGWGNINHFIITWLPHEHRYYMVVFRHIPKKPSLLLHF